MTAQAMFSAKRFEGEQKASGTLALQLPLIAKHFPEIRDCHPGTINLEFEHPLVIAGWDFRTPALDWKPGKREVFDLVRVSLEAPCGGIAHRAWLYVAHRSKHRTNLARHEIIAPYIEPTGAETFGVVIHRKCERLAYRHNPIAVVL